MDIEGSYYSVRQLATCNAGTVAPSTYYVYLRIKEMFRTIYSECEEC